MPKQTSSSPKKNASASSSKKNSTPQVKGRVVSKDVRMNESSEHKPLIPFFKNKQFKNGRIYLAESKNFVGFPDLLALQKKGFDEFVNEYINRLFDEINPIQDIAGDKLYLTITGIKVSEEIESIDICKKKELTYGGVITGQIKLTDSVTKKVLFSKRVNIGILPLMTPSGSYIVNGVERVIVSQIVRSFGIFYNFKDFKYSFKLIPERGPWLQVMIEKSGIMIARINKSRKFPITTLLRAFGYETDDSIRALFEGVLDEEDTDFIELTLKKDTTTDALSAAEFIYNKLRPGELVDRESALDYVKAQFMDEQRIFVGRIARRKINAKLDLDRGFDYPESNVYDEKDLAASLKYLLCLANEKKGFYLDDNDHLANKRIRTMGEMLYHHLQPVMKKFVKSIKGKLSVLNLENQIKLNDLANFKIVDSSIKSFFATSQLSQFLDQINPLADIEHKRRITALGSGGLKRETAKFDVRDVHPSHYGRICPIQTPEGANIGLVLFKSLFSKVNPEGFLETPAIKVARFVKPVVSQLANRVSKESLYELDAKGNATKKLIVDVDQYISPSQATLIEKFYGKKGNLIKVKPFVTEEIEYISPELDEKYYIADVTTQLDDYKNIVPVRVAGRHFNEMEMFHVNDITHVDVNPSQIFSANPSMIPFVNHNDTVRAQIGTNQLRQALPLLKSEAPLVGTGFEGEVISDSYAVIKAEDDGEVIYVDGNRIKVKYKSGTKEYGVMVFKKSNQKSAIHQKVRVSLGQKVTKGTILAEGPCVENGELALGINLRVAYMEWDGYNFEDSAIISQRLVKDDALTSIHIEDYKIEVSDTKLGPEMTTNDIPGVSLNKLKNLDEDGIIRIGSVVKGGDILIGKITPKSEGDLSPEEKLIQAIFGDRSKSVKDTSLYLPAGSEGKVVDVVILDSKKGDNLMAGVKKKIKVLVAMTRKIEVGDKLTNKHGHKGIISVVVPEEDMPYTEDGQSIDILLNPVGVISRMNMGQVFETQLGYIAKALGVKFAVPAFGGFAIPEMKQIMSEAGFSDDLKMAVYDGRTGEALNKKVTVGYMHILKLVHMVEDKIHSRSVGPYSLITQQPLGGKSREGGQRFGEMEVWALEAYSAVYTLQEMLTVKSDDITGRNKTYEAIIKGMKPRIGGLPESFNFLTYLFKGLGQNIIPMSAEQLDDLRKQRYDKIMKLGLQGITSQEGSALTKDANDGENTDFATEDKNVIYDTVVEDLTDYGEME